MLLDTHAVVFLHAGEIGLFSETGRYFLDTEDLWINPMVIMELQYLREIGRITVCAKEILADLRSDLGLRVLDRRWEDVCVKALELCWTRDPFDRIITAHAIIEGQRLLTKDRIIRENCTLAFWD